jgi:hypothetical protein
MRELFPTCHVLLKGNCLDGHHLYYQGRTVEGGCRPPSSSRSRIVAKRKKPEALSAEEKLGDAIHIVAVVELAIGSYADQHSGNRQEASSMCILLQKATELPRGRAGVLPSGRSSPHAA